MNKMEQLPYSQSLHSNRWRQIIKSEIIVVLVAVFPEVKTIDSSWGWAAPAGMAMKEA